MDACCVLCLGPHSSSKAASFYCSLIIFKHFFKQEETPGRFAATGSSPFRRFFHLHEIPLQGMWKTFRTMLLPIWVVSCVLQPVLSWWQHEYQGKWDFWRSNVNTDRLFINLRNTSTSASHLSSFRLFKECVGQKNRAQLSLILSHTHSQLPQRCLSVYIPHCLKTLLDKIQPDTKLIIHPFRHFLVLIWLSPESR